MLLLPTPVCQQHTGTHNNSSGGPSLYHRSWPLSFLHLPSTPSPWLLSITRASCTIYSSESAMMARSSAYSSSQGTPERNSCDKASSRMMESRGDMVDTNPHLKFLAITLRHEHGFGHWHKFPGLTTQYIPQCLALSPSATMVSVALTPWFLRSQEYLYFELLAEFLPNLHMRFALWGLILKKNHQNWDFPSFYKLLIISSLDNGFVWCSKLFLWFWKKICRRQKSMKISQYAEFNIQGSSINI